MCGEDDPTLVAERNERLRKLGPEPSWWRFRARRQWRRDRAAIVVMDVSVFAAMVRSFYTPEYVAKLAARPSMLQVLYKTPYSVRL